jgi:nicotinate-nucleotide adenylyltransferase
MKVGILGGSFDPIHFGHLRAAENAREALDLDLVLFVPAALPPHKAARDLAPAEDRLAMVRLAVASNGAFSPSELELRREGPSYTVDTVEALAQERPGDELFLVVGSDTLPEMGTWREPQRLFALCTVAVAPRPGTAAASAPAGARTRIVEGPELPVSATFVRERARAGRSVRYLVPDPVADYIEERRLYR